MSRIPTGPRLPRTLDLWLAVLIITVAAILVVGALAEAAG